MPHTEIDGLHIHCEAHGQASPPVSDSPPEAGA